MTNLGRRRILALTFSLCILVLMTLSFSSQTSRVCWADQSDMVGRAIDVYTNKDPYSGRGANQESDAFEPQEEVVLYALVTYNGDPVAGKIVAFDVQGPPNSVENITLTISAITDENGIADVSFILPWPDATPRVAIFGVWTVVASVDIASVVVSDTLWFNAGWIIELLYIRTVDLNNVLKSTFGKLEQMGFRLGVRNIAMSQKVATLVVAASDELNVSIGMLRLEDEIIPPGEKEYFMKEMTIPQSAFVGQGRATANALKTGENGSIPWCPAVETAFWIGIIHDVAVLNVVPSAHETYHCQTVNITVLVKNKGQVDESFYVSVYYNSTLIEKLWIDSLAPKAERILTVTWYIDYIQIGDYKIKAEAGPVGGETNLGDNVFIDGAVTIRSSVYPPGLGAFDMRWLLAALFILIVLVGALLVLAVLMLLVCRRRRKREEEEPRRIMEPGKIIAAPMILPLLATKKCEVCGKEFSGVYTFCPHCMSFHGRDFD